MGVFITQGFVQTAESIHLGRKKENEPVEEVNYYLLTN